MNLLLRMAAAALSLALLTGCGASAPLTPLEQAQPIADVAYVPLDDRPVNLDRVVYLGESLGYRMLLPETALFHTALDEQPKNLNGSACGDRGALLDWVLEKENQGCDRYILSLDQLLSGGLVSSRSFTGGPVRLADGRVLSERECIDLLLDALGGDPDNRVYLLDTVMRLAPTVGYDGWDLEGYQLLRDYGMVRRPVLSGDALTVENIQRSYGLDADGKALDPADYSLSPARVAQYHAARGRKLALSAHALDGAADLEHVHLLIGVDDSAPSASIQTNEIALLKQGADAVLSGADEDGMLAVCRMFAQEDARCPMPTAWVRYFGGTENAASSDFDHQPMTEIVEAHLDYLGMPAMDSAEADLQVLVLTAPDAQHGKTAIRDLIAALRENERENIPTILLDAAKNGYEQQFQKALVKKYHLGSLLGYAGFYDLANVTGIGLSCGAARWLYLASGQPRDPDREAAFQRTLADSLLKDICYKNDVKPAMALWIRDELSGDPDNFAKSGTDQTVILDRLETEMDRATVHVLNNLARSNLFTDLDGTQAGWGPVTLSGFQYPWQRVFEVHMDLDIGPSGKPHRAGLLGLF